MGTKFATSALSNSMEAGIGSMWGENPKYHRAGTGTVKQRVWYALKMVVLADSPSGVRPAYARFIAYPSSRVISNSWREPSEVTAGDTTQRIGWAFAGRAGGNLFSEFWPDLRRKLRRK